MWGGAAANKSTGPPREDVVSVDKAARTAVGDVVADVAATGERERFRRRGGGYGMAAGVFASAGESSRTAVGDGFPDEDITGRGNGGYSCE